MGLIETLGSKDSQAHAVLSLGLPALGRCPEASGKQDLLRVSTLLLLESLCTAREGRPPAATIEEGLGPLTLPPGTHPVNPKRLFVRH